MAFVMGNGFAMENACKVLSTATQPLARAWSSTPEWAKIATLSMGATTLFGITLPQITFRISEKLAKQNADLYTGRLPRSWSSLEIAKIGLKSSWWLGSCLSAHLTACARLGTRTKLTASDLIASMGVAAAFTASSALITGLITATVYKEITLESGQADDQSCRFPGKDFYARRRFAIASYTTQVTRYAAQAAGVGLCWWALSSRS